MNQTTIVVNLEGMSKETIRTTLYNKVTPFINSTHTTLIAYTENIECHMKLESAGLYSVTAKYIILGTQSEVKVRKDDLLNHLLSLFCIGTEIEDAAAAPAKKKERKKIIECGTPMDIRAGLDKYIISQDGAKKTLSVAAYNHAVRVNMEDNSDIYKANVLLIGPTGTGKTAIVRALAEHNLHIPYCTISATTLSATGFVGSDVTDSLALLLNQTKKFSPDGKISVPHAEAGIIFIDEIDKIRMHGSNNSSGVDVNGEAVQQALLSLVEGNNFDVQPDGKFGTTITINTRNILFIVGGAFSGLATVIRERLNKRPDPADDIDYDALSDDEILQFVKDADLEAFGFIPEFIGRFPNVSILSPLSTEDYLRILTEPKDSLVNQFTAIFKESNATPEFSDTFLKWVAKECTKRNRGARGLRCIFEDLLRDTMYVIPSLAPYSPRVFLAMDDADKLYVRFTFKNAPEDKVRAIFDKCEFENATGRLEFE